MKKLTILLLAIGFVLVGAAIGDPHLPAAHAQIDNGSPPQETEHVWYVPGECDVAPYITGLMSWLGMGWCTVRYPGWPDFETLDPNVSGCENRNSDIPENAVYNSTQAAEDIQAAADNWPRRWHNYCFSDPNCESHIADIMTDPPHWDGHQYVGNGWGAMFEGNVIVARASDSSSTQILYIWQGNYGCMRDHAADVMVACHDPDWHGSFADWIQANIDTDYMVHCYHCMVAVDGPADAAARLARNSKEAQR